MIGLPSLALVIGIAAAFGGVPAAMAGRRWSYRVSAVGSGLLLVAGVLAVALGPFTAVSWSGPIGEAESLRLDPLSGFFLLVAATVWFATALYSVRYDDHPGASLAIAYSLTIGSIAVLFAATNFLLFLAAWEAMTLAAYWMILEASGERARVYSAGFLFLAFGEASTVLLAVMIAAWYGGTGSFGMTAAAVVLPVGSLVFVAALLGFGLKMGIAPFHMSEWLPVAHSAAPSNASALLSSTLTLAGVYGLFRVLALLGPGPAWWGALLLVIGAIAVLLGAVFAAVNEHAKGLPAYSTIENNGLILVALGIALIARAEGLPTLATFALFAALFQAFAHAITKAALFLFAGEIERASHTLDLTQVRGQVRVADPAGSGAGLVAALSLAAAPPLAGFVSEWMILESLFQSYRFGNPALQFIGLLSGAAVALSAGLILLAMVKFAGFAALWTPSRSPARERTTGLGRPIVGLAAVVVGLGVLAPPILTFLAPTASVAIGAAVSSPVGGLLAIPNGWSIVSGSPFGIISPPAVAVALGVGLLPALTYLGLGRHRGTRRAPAWSGGRAPPLSSETYTSFGFSTGMRIMLGSLLGTHEIRRATELDGTGPAPARGSWGVELEVLDYSRSFYDVLERVVSGFAARLRRGLMPGRIGRYLAYILVATMAVIIYVAILG